jgi:hypothetical protein
MRCINYGGGLVFVSVIGLLRCATKPVLRDREEEVEAFARHDDSPNLSGYPGSKYFAVPVP